ncbi:MAG: peptidoglycan DD-metalloendopeptidase family protein [Bacteroidia bacterium]
MKKLFAINVFLIFTTISLSAQVSEKEPAVIVNDEFHPCIDEETYRNIDDEISRNRKLLGLDHVQHNQTFTTSLQWPLRPAAALQDCGYYYISAFVDLDTTSALLDWNCGTRTYNAHRGVDIVPWPFIWNKMDNNLTEVIAAAPGTIIAKVDGNFDRVCNGVGGGSNSNNYITIQHADGSTALYVHMKTGSMTTKTVGQTVSAGEFLGIVGSAGQSTGVHLHFEIRSDGTFAHYIDPFYGTCNTSIGASWWASQKPYTEPQLMKLSLHSSWPYMASCPNTVDTTYEQDTFFSNPGQQATFYACTKHVSAGDVWNFRILDPNQVVIDSWNYTSSTDRLTSTLGWNKVLPTAAGIYTVEGTFHSVTCARNFTIQTSTQAGEFNRNDEVASIVPNPTGGNFELKLPAKFSGAKNTIKLYNSFGNLIWTGSTTDTEIDFKLGLTAGIYYFTVLSENCRSVSGKFVAQ